MAAMAMVAFLCLGAFGVMAADGVQADEPAVPAVTFEWDVVSDEDEGIAILYVSSAKKVTGGEDVTMDDLLTAEQIDKIFGKDKYGSVMYSFSFNFAEGKSIADVPSGLVQYFDVAGKTVAFPMDMKASIAATIVGGIIVLDVTKAVETAVIVPVMDDAIIIGLEEYAEMIDTIADLQDEIIANEIEIEALEAEIAELEEDESEKVTKLKEQIAGLQAEIEADEADIADLEKQLEEAQKNKGGDATVAWCVAALGIIAAGVLAGFIFVAYSRAKKDGRRLI